MMVAILADRMLEGLARRLRLMGYDCELAPPWARSSLAVLEYAGRTGRPLVTTAPGRLAEARRFSARLRPAAVAGSGAGPPPPLPEVLLVPLGDWRAQARMVADRWPIEIARLAFTRCSRDNAPLRPAAFEEVATRLPPRVRQARPALLRRCPACGRLYWPGTHVARIRDEWERLRG